MKAGEAMILDRIAEATRIRVSKSREQLPLSEILERIQEGGQLKDFHNRSHTAFTEALRKEGMSVICEVKKASPSKGVIAEEFPYLQIAEEYEAAGADAISVLTEPDYFLGSTQYLERISHRVGIPVLRKEFILEEYQLYESKLIGADAVLLICSLLGEKLKQYLELCGKLKLSALVETHTEDEIRLALSAGAQVIGVNNRNLQTFEVDIRNSIRLRRLVPEEILFVAESGINSPEDMLQLREAGVDAVLIGEALMRSSDRRALLEYLKDSR